MYLCSGTDERFANGVDSLVEDITVYNTTSYMCTAHVLIAQTRSSFNTSSRYVVICWSGVIKIWNK